MNKPLTIAVGAIVLLGGVLVFSMRSVGEKYEPLTVGSKAPDFKVKTLDATPATKTRASFKGQVVLLNLWATWCGPCRVEMPSIQKLHAQFADSGLHVVAISVDEEGKEQAIKEFTSSMGLTFEVLYNPSGDIQMAYQTAGLPETFLIGKDGKIRKRMLGGDDWSSPANQALVRAMLAEPGT
jgi:cytochrome c biogenesis protein CcmG/thiol:disulfide interchange protein DsbE